MKVINPSQGYDCFHSPFLNADGHFVCVERGFFGSNKSQYRAINLSTEQKYQEIKFGNRNNTQIYFSKDGMILVNAYESVAAKCYDLFTGNRLKKREYFRVNQGEALFTIYSINIAEVRDVGFASGLKWSVFLPDFQLYWYNRSMNSSALCSALNEVNKNRRLFQKSKNFIIICPNDGSRARIMELWFPPKSVTISPDGLTVLVHSDHCAAIIDLE